MTDFDHDMRVGPHYDDGQTRKTAKQWLLEKEAGMINKDELSKVKELKILSMDGTEEWFVRVMQSKPWKHDIVATTHHIPEYGKPTYTRCERCQMQTLLPVHAKNPCTVPPSITEPLEVLAFRLANEAWPENCLYNITVDANFYLGSYPRFTPIDIIRASLIAMKRSDK